MNQVNRLTAPVSLKLDDDKAEQVRRSHEEKLKELQSTVLAGAVTASASLVDTKKTSVPHRLGKRPTLVIPSLIRGATAAGVLVENSRDEKFVYVTATGFGATITVDLVVA